jgi:hypothetical protein
MAARLAYARAGAAPPEGDAYRATYRGSAGEQVELDREIVKTLFSACLFAEKPLRQWPEDLRDCAAGLKVAKAIAGIAEAHPALAPLFFTGVGHGLMFTESQILVEVLLRLIERGLTALPVHDAIVVAESAQEEAERVMREAFEFHTGLDARISIERPEQADVRAAPRACAR